MNLFILFHSIIKVVLLVYTYANQIDSNQYINSRIGKTVLWNNQIKDNNNLDNIHYHTKSTIISDLISSRTKEWNNYDSIIIFSSKLAYQNNDFLSSSVINHSIKQSKHTDVYTNVIYDSRYDTLTETYSEESTLNSLISKSIQITTKSNLFDINLDDFKEFYSDKSISNFAKTKVFKISLTKQDLTNESLSSILDINQNNILYIYIQENDAVPSDINILQSGNYHRILSTDTIDGENYSPEGSEYSIYYGNTYLYITPDIFSGILTGLFILFVILIGLNCLGSIQGMTSFYDRLPSVGKEA